MKFLTTRFYTKFFYSLVITTTLILIIPELAKARLENEAETIPIISSVRIKNKRLQVIGTNFKSGSKIEVDGVLYTDTTRNKQTPSKQLASVSGAKLEKGSYIVTVRLNEIRSIPFIFDNGVENGIPKVTISVTPSPIEILLSQEGFLSAKAFDASGKELSQVNFSWTTSNPQIATVDQTGKVTALSVGTITVKVSALRNEGQAEVHSKLRNTGPPGIQISLSNPVVNEGQSIILSATARNNEGELIPDAIINWTSDSLEVATVDNQGKVQGLKRGFATITAMIANTSELTTASVILTVARVEATEESTPSQTGAITIDSSGRIYQTDISHQIVRRGIFGQALELYAGIKDTPGRIDGKRLSSKFNTPIGISIDVKQGKIYIADSANNAVRSIEGLNESVITIAGKETPGDTDGPIATALFRNPKGITTDENGNIYVADTGNHTIRFINLKKGTVSTIAGTPGQSGFQDGNGTSAKFKSPEGLSFDTTSRILIVADTGNNVVRLISKSGEVSTISSTSGGNFAKSTLEATFFNQPKTIGTDALGNIYVGEQGTVSVVLKIRNDFQQALNITQPKTFSTVGFPSVYVLGTDVYAWDTNDQLGLKRITFAPPEILQITPLSSSLEGGIKVNVTGRNFSIGTDVLLDGQPVTELKLEDATHLSFVAPPAIASGVRTLTVQHRGGIDQAPFAYDPPDLTQIPPGSITSIAGGSQFGGDGGLASRAILADPRSLTLDATGNLYFTDTLFNRVRRVDAQSKIITTVAGTGRIGFSGDGKLATESDLNAPESVTTDALGNLYIADRQNGRIRKVDALTNRITTIAGGGTPTDGIGDGPALLSRIEPRTIVLKEDQLYIADQANLRIRNLNLSTGMITTILGAGPGKSISFQDISSLAIGIDGKFFISDAINKSIHIIDLTNNQTKEIKLPAPTIGPPQTLPYSINFDVNGNLLIGTNNHLLRLNVLNGTFQQIDKKGPPLGNVTGIATDGFGNLFIADDGDFGIDAGPGRIFRADADLNKIDVYAGGGDSVMDGRRATASFLQPYDCALNVGGEIFIADAFNDRIRKVSVLSGPINTFAGGGKPTGPPEEGSIGDGGPAIMAVLRGPQGIVFNPETGYIIADSGNSRIRLVSRDGRISTIAGNGQRGMGGDGGSGVRAQLQSPVGLGIDVRRQILYFTDARPFDSRIRALNLRTGMIGTIIGNSPPGFSGDGGPARIAQINRPTNLVVDKEGNLIFADTLNHRIRRIDANSNIITTIAGNGNIGPNNGGFAGDNGPAKQALLNSPTGLAMDGKGNLFIGDAGNYRIRRIDIQTGIITTIAGNGNIGFDNDGKPATTAKLGIISNLVIDPRGNLYICDSLFGVVRVVKEIAIPINPPVSDPQ